MTKKDKGHGNTKTRVVLKNVQIADRCALPPRLLIYTGAQCDQLHGAEFVEINDPKLVFSIERGMDVAVFI